MSLESWETLAARERMLVEAAEQYSVLDAAFGAWTESEVEGGTFEAPGSQ
jgi:hypothetical protein